jgi:uncharacterized damage-inducible protein DinB
MTDANSLIQTLERNEGLIKEQAKGLEHADTVLQLPFRGNCFNWVVGHMLVSRDAMLSALGAEPVLSEEEHKMYGHGSEPVCGPEDGVHFHRLMEALDQTTEAVSAALNSATPEQLGKIHSEERGWNVWEWVVFLVWHDTYHVGQLEILRQLAGTDDAII